MRIVETRDVVEQRHARGVMGSEGVVLQEFALQRGEERLSDDIVLTVALIAH
jgi:hypothetical protein